MPGEQVRVEAALAVDQPGSRSVSLGHLDEATRIRAGLGADHEDQGRAALRQPLDGVLPVLGRVTDVVRRRPLQVAEALAERVHGLGDVVERERRLRDHRDRLAARVQLRRVLGRLDHDRLVRPLAARADHLDVVGVTDQRDEVAAVGVAPGLRVHLRDERAHRVHHDEAALLAVLPHRGRDPVCREHADRSRRDLVLVVDEDGAEPLEPLDHVVVVHDLVAHVDRRTVLLQQDLDDLDRPVDSGAERPGCCEEDLAYEDHPLAAAPSRSSARLASEAARAKPRGSRANARTRPGQS